MNNKELLAVIMGLLEHPYPNDLVEVRRRVHDEFGGSDEAARDEMETWCSADFCEDAMERYNEARAEGYRALSLSATTPVAKVDAAVEAWHQERFMSDADKIRLAEIITEHTT